MTQKKAHRAKRILDAVTYAYPHAWAQLDHFRRLRGESPESAMPEFRWPDWCYMPIAGGYAIVSGGGANRVTSARAHHPAVITALGSWRMTQGIYRFDPALLPDLLSTRLDGDIPVEHLQRLPEWCCYIELDAAEIRPGLHGAWIHLEYDVNTGGTEFRAVLDTARDPRQPFAPDGLQILPLPLAGTIEQSFDALEASARRQASASGMTMPAIPQADRSAGRQLLEPLLSLALYLCAAPDLARRTAPSSPARTRLGAAPAATGPTEWDVGVRMGAALRAAYAREQTGGEAAPTGRHVRPHIRRAHWHTILSGPRLRDGADIPAAERQRDLRWMPPIPVALDDVDQLPAVIRRVP